MPAAIQDLLSQVLSGDLTEPGCVSSREELLCRAAVNPQSVQEIAKKLLEEPSHEEVFASCDASDAYVAAKGVATEGLLASLVLTSTLSPEANSSEAADEELKGLKLRGPRQVCQYAFRRNDIVWICRSCQKDETCVLCNACFRDSQHEGHEVFFYHAQAGGCCDCGDGGAWAPQGFCSKHGKAHGDPLASLEPAMVANARATLAASAQALLHVGQEARDSFDTVRSFKYRHARQRNAAKMKKKQSTGAHAATGASSSSSSSTQKAAMEAAAEVDTTSTAMEEGAHELADDVCGGGLSALQSPTGFFLKPPLVKEGEEDGVFLEEEAEIVVQWSDVVSKVELEKALSGVSEVPALKAATCLAEGSVAVAKQSSSVWAHTWAANFDLTPATETSLALAAMTEGAASDDDDEDDEEGGARKERAEEAAAYQLLLDLDALTSAGLPMVSVRPASLLARLRRAAAALKFMHSLSQTCDGMCRLVCEALSPDVLMALMRVDAYLPKPLAAALHSLFLTLMADQTFKVAIARAYTSVYLGLTYRFARGIGNAEHALYTLSVQFLNRDLFVHELVEEYALLPNLADAVRDTIAVAQAPYMTPTQQTEKASGRARRAQARDRRLQPRVRTASSSASSSSLSFASFASGTALGSLFGSRLTRSDPARVGPSEMAQEEDEEEGDDDCSSEEDDGEEEAALEALADGYDPTRRWRPKVKALKKVSSFSSSLSLASRQEGANDKGKQIQQLHCEHPLLVHRRYSPVLGDLKCVLNVSDMARRFCVDPPSDYHHHHGGVDDADEEDLSGGALSLAAGGSGKRRLRRRRQRDCLGAWCDALAMAERMHPEVRRERGQHVEFESRTWMHAFNLNISLTSAFDFMTAWLKKSTQLQDQGYAAELLGRTLGAVQQWQGARREQVIKVPLHPLAWVEGKNGRNIQTRTHLQLWSHKVINGDGSSFHAPLHRFLATAIVETSRASVLTPVLEALVQRISGPKKTSALDESILSSSSSFEQLGQIDLCSVIGLLEVPLQVLKTAAEVRCGMWRRNGHGIADQLMNYAEPPFCRLFRDLDLALLQFIALAYPSASAVEVEPYGGEGVLGDEFFDARAHDDDEDRDVDADDESHSNAFAAGEALGTNNDTCQAETNSHDNKKKSFGCFVSHLVHRFGLWSHFLRDDVLAEALKHPNGRMLAATMELRQCEDDLAEDKGDLCWSVAPCSAEESVPLMEELLMLLIVLLTELPPPPPQKSVTAASKAAAAMKSTSNTSGSGGGGDASGLSLLEDGSGSPQSAAKDQEPQEPDERTIAQVRREVVHKLASSPCTHSEATEVLALVAKPEAAAALEIVLGEVADCRPARDLEPAKFSLKPRCWSEYDPCFLHLSSTAHQAASERRPTPLAPGNTGEVLEASPLVGPPPLCHELWLPLRRNGLSDPVLLRLVLVVLQRALSPAAGSPCTDALLMRCLHLLTLGVHEAIDAKLEGSSTGTAYCQAYFAAWRETSAVNPPQLSATSDSGVPSDKEACLLHVLRRLPSTAWASDATIGRALKWLLKQATRLDATCAAALQKVDNDSGQGSSSGESMEARRKAARERAMAAMAAKASAFMASAEMEDSESESEEEGDAGPKSADNGPDALATAGSVASSDSSSDGGIRGGDTGDKNIAALASEGKKASDETNESSVAAPAAAHVHSEYECIICREVSESRPLGLLGMAQVCKTVGGVDEAKDEGNIGAFQAITHRMRSGVVITCCGHALHYDCYEAYFASTVQKAESSPGHNSLEIRDGELQCPFCKRVANLLVPLVPPEGAGDSSVNKGEEERNRGGVESQMTTPSPLAVEGEPEDREVDNNQIATSREEEEISWLQDLLSSLKLSDGHSDDELNHDDDALEHIFGGGFMEGGPLGVMTGAFARHLSEMGKPQRRGWTSHDTEPWRHSASSDVTAFAYSVAAFAYSTCAFVAEDGNNGDIDVDDTTDQGLSASEGGGGDSVVPVGEVATARRKRHLQAVGNAVLAMGKKRQALLRLVLSHALVGGGGASEGGSAESSGGGSFETEAFLGRNMMETMLVGLCCLGATKAPVLGVVRTCLLGRHCQLMWPLAHYLAKLPATSHLSDESRANVSQQAADACGGEAEAMASLDLALELAHALASTHGDELVGEDANEVTAAEIINKAVSMLTTAAVGVSAFLRVACAMVDLLELHDGAVNGNTLRMPTINVMPSPALVATVRQWCRHALQQGSDVASRFGDAPSLEKFQLSVLPPSYTDLHCDLVQQLSDSLGASETTEVRPALCLLCGTVLDANGKGKCTAHAATCGHGNGVFFLLQECIVVLMHGTRAAYLPAPYVDRHGEKHGQFRGRPLHLDQQRLNLLRNLVAMHEVPARVVHSRSTSHKIIIPNYY